MATSRKFQWGVVAVLAIAGGLLVAAGTMQVMHPPAAAEGDDEQAASAPAAERTRGAARAPRVEETDGVHQRTRIRTDVFAKAAVMSVQTPSDRNYVFSYSHRVGPGGMRIDPQYFRLTRLATDEALQKAANLSPEQIAKVREVPGGVPFPVEAKPRLEELFRKFMDAGAGPGRDKVKADLLAALGEASDKMIAEAAVRSRSITSVLTTDQLTAVRSRGAGAAPRAATPRPGGGGGGVVRPPTGGPDLP